MSTHSAVDMTHRMIFSNSSSPKTKKSIFGEVTWHIKMTKRMVVWTFLIIMRDKADVAQFKFPINVAKSIFLIEIYQKILLLAPAYLTKKRFWFWKVFLQTGNSVGLTVARWRKGRQGATWVAIPLPGASFQELFSLPGTWQIPTCDHFFSLSLWLHAAPWFRKKIACLRWHSVM